MVSKREDTRVIISHLQGNSEVVLTNDQKDIIERANFADNLLRKYNKRSDVVNMIQVKFSVSRVQAHRIIWQAEEIFNSFSSANKEYWKGIAVEWCVDAINLARKSRDLKAYNAAITNFIKALGLDKQDAIDFDFSKIEPHTYKLELDAESLKLLKAMSSKGSFNLGDFFSASAEEVKAQNG